MRPLIVMGASEHIKDRLFQKFPDHVIFVTGRAEAFEAIEQHPAAVLAYAPEAFAGAVGGNKSPLWPYVHTDHPQVLVSDGIVTRTVDGLSPTEDVTDDPRQHADSAAAALHINLPTVDVDNATHLSVLKSFLAAPSPVRS